MKIRSLESLPIDCIKLCCNFVNTVYAWRGDDDYDYLLDYNYFIDWCDKLGITEKSRLNQLRQKAKKEPTKAVSASHKIKAIRLLIYKLISAVASNDRKNYIALLNDVNPLIQEAKSNTRLEFEGKKFIVHFQRDPIDLLSPVWQILESLNTLLVSDDLKRIKQCPKCGWVFYDTTKNGTRRWCNPLNCGTKDKMDRYMKKLKRKK